MMLLSLLPSLLLLRPAQGYSSGAPRGACDSMRPSHGPGASVRQGAPPPYALQAPSSARPGQRVTVSLGGASFKGFMVRALDGAGNSVGRFLAEPSDSWQVMTCQKSADTATHQRGPPYSQLQLTWEAPSSPGTYRLLATVVQEYTEVYAGYYADVKVSPGGGSSEEVGGERPQRQSPQRHRSGGNSGGHSHVISGGHSPGNSGGHSHGNSGGHSHGISGGHSPGNTRSHSHGNSHSHNSFVGNRYSTSFRPERHPRLPVSPHHPFPSINPFQPRSPHQGAPLRRDGFFTEGKSHRRDGSAFLAPQQPFRGHFPRV